MALSQKNRLSTQDFAKIKNKSGLWARESCLSVKSVKNNLQESRFGVVIGSSVSKKAVLRNKIKRRLKDIIHKNIPNIKSGFDVIVIANPQIKEKSHKELEKILSSALNRIKLFIVIPNKQ